jgi:hypothetical protein
MRVCWQLVNILHLSLSVTGGVQCCSLFRSGSCSSKLCEGELEAITRDLDLLHQPSCNGLRGLA